MSKMETAVVNESRREGFDRFDRFDALVWTGALICALILVSTTVQARSRFANDNAVYRNECGSCHIAYPPALLSAEGWRSIMGNLDRHFGTDATSSGPAHDEIAAYLSRVAGTRKGLTAPRITQTAWFRKEHREIAARTWTLAAVKTAANCSACHVAADRGDFSEHNIRLPR